MWDDWRYIINSQDCHINIDGDVIQANQLVKPYAVGSGYRAVELFLQTNEYDHELGRWKRAPQEVYVHSLMLDTWFSNWPMGAKIHFIDGDRYNCAASNLRAVLYENGVPRIVQVREEKWGYAFDLRLRGKVEIVETEQVYSGVRAAAKAVRGDPAAVSRVLSGELEQHRGLHFRWV